MRPACLFSERYLRPQWVSTKNRHPRSGRVDARGTFLVVHVGGKIGLDWLLSFRPQPEISCFPGPQVKIYYFRRIVAAAPLSSSRTGVAVSSLMIAETHTLTYRQSPLP